MIDAKTKGGFGKLVNKTHIMNLGIPVLDFFKHRSRSMLLSFNNKTIKVIMNTYFPESSSVLVFVYFHFEPDNDFAIRCTLAVLIKL
jgi:hypothetical protein